MGSKTTIQVPEEVRDRLKRFGHKGQTYAEILTALMDQVEYEEFMAEQYRRLEADRDDFVPLDEDG